MIANRIGGALTAALLGLLTAFPALAGAPGEGLRPALWRVADADTEILLFGGLHALRAEDAWLFPALEQALAGADAVYFETTMDPRAEAEAAGLAARLGRGGGLAAGLSPEGRARLARVSADLSVSVEGLRPWRAALGLTAAAAARDGAEPALGVDRTLLRAARRAGVEIRGLETPAAQIRLLADLDGATQRRMLEASLIALETRPNRLTAMIEAWRRGDLGALSALTRESLRGAPALEKRLLTDRNAAWAGALARLLAQEQGRFLVVVGAGHLLGEDGVPAQLARRGYPVRRR